MTSNEVRATFLDYFRAHQHEIVPSAPVVPQDDPTLLFTNAGMNQFKPIFLGLQKPSSPRIADTQKCVRVSGKHNDLEEVGRSPYHHTFFEMLGNWSFGDYFKKEAIVWAWELMTKGYGLPKDKLYATVFETDDEAEALWRSETDINPKHVLRFGKKDNWWSMGDTGPSGPCSELHIDRGPAFDSDPKAFVNTDSPRYIELWNLVFIQYDTQPDGSHVPLPQKHVDTGAGLERLTTVLNGLPSNYDTDLFQPIIQEIVRLSNKEYDQGSAGVPHRVIADHIRCLSFALADGAMPGNEGRGHVLRSILRRAARFGRKLEMHEPFLHRLVPVVIDKMAGQFPELKDRHVHITRVIEAEETSFGKTLDRGLEEFDRVVSTLTKSNDKVIPGEEAFKLFDTFGFHLDLTQQMAGEHGLTVDVKGFEQAMEGQRQRARASGSFKTIAGEALSVESEAPTEFIGYDSLELDVTVKVLKYDPKSRELVFTTERTPFYAESGGQVADRGTLSSTDANFAAEISDVRRLGNTVVHTAVLSKGHELPKLNDGAQFAAHLSVSPQHRVPTQYNHTATHLLQKALRETLGEHVHQSGSLVAPDHLRFDFTHFDKLSDAEIAKIEAQVNTWIRDNYPVRPVHTTLKEAQAKGAMALFGEKYGEDVRMIEIGEDEQHVISRELCGGCHVNRTGDIGLFVITSESSVAAGIRRLEAKTGEAARQYLISERAKTLESLEAAEAEKRKLQKELERLKMESASSEMSALTQQAETIGSAKLVASEVQAESLDQLKEMGDAVRDGLKSGVGVLATVINEKPQMVVVVTPDLVKQGVDAVPIVRELGKRLQGGGGGKPHMATAGGKNAAGIPQVIADARGVIEKFLASAVK